MTETLGRNVDSAQGGNIPSCSTELANETVTFAVTTVTVFLLLPKCTTLKQLRGEILRTVQNLPI